MSSDRLAGRKTLKVASFLEEFEKEEVKRGVDIVGLFNSFGVKLARKGKSYSGLCPWHEDKNPSLSVDREQGLYHCFGCGEAGDVVSLVEKMKGVGFREALEYLRKEAGRLPAPAPSKPDPKPPAKEPESPPADLKLSLTTVVDYYHRRFLESREAQSYLEARGIRKPDLYRRFHIGYADGSLLTAVSNGQKRRLKELGVVGERGKERFFKRVILPIFNGSGEAVGLYGRSVREGAKLKHLYLPGKHRGVFNRSAGRAFEEILLTEGILDALSLMELGIENVQSLYGAAVLTEEHLQALKEDRVKTVVLALDNDEAGRRATEELASRLLSEGLAVKKIFPEAKDWNEELAGGADPKALKQKIASAPALRPPEGPREITVHRERAALLLTFGEIRYRVSGLRELFVASLRVNIRAEYRTERFYDNLDLYSARSRTTYSEHLGRLFGVEPKRIENDLVRILEHLEEERDRRFAVEPEAGRPPELSEGDRRLGLAFLRSPHLFDEIVRDMEALGYVGEDLNKQLVYLAASSRKLQEPICLLLLSQSASGKSLLVDTVRRLMPEEELIAVTSLSDQALNYLPEGALEHKFLVLGEAVHSEAVEHQVREMLSSRELSRMVTVKDEKTGKMKSIQVSRRAVVSLVMSTTRGDLNPENASRFFLINADESEAQTRRIHQAQREKYSLKRLQQRRSAVPQIVRKHHAAQRLLAPLPIVNPFASYLDFPTALVRTRRDHERFVDLIAAVCFLRQYQKQRKRSRESAGGEEIEYIECDLTDYRVAYRIMVGGVLSSTFAELPRSLVRLYEELRAMFCEQAKTSDLKPTEVTLTARQIRRQVRWVGGESVKKYLRKLTDYEYLQVAQGGQRGMRNSYRLAADEPIERLDCSMIPTPEAIASRLLAEGAPA